MSPCHRCAKALGRSCCEVGEGEHLATLTHADVARLREETGLAASRFSETEVLGHEEALAYEARRPLYAGYFRHGPFRLTLKAVKGACVFFRAGQGCGLSAQARPTACRLYPFELWADGSWSVQVGKHGSPEEARRAGPGGACLAVEEADEMEGLLQAFGSTREEVEALGERLRQEVRAHGRESSAGARRMGE